MSDDRFEPENNPPPPPYKRQRKPLAPWRRVPAEEMEKFLRDYERKLHIEPKKQPKKQED